MDLLHHPPKFDGAGTSHAARGAKRSMLFSFVFFVCFFVRHAFGKTDGGRHITMKELELRKKVGTVR